MAFLAQENQADKSGDSLPHYARYNPPANMDAGSAKGRQNLSLDSEDTLPPGNAALPNNEDTSSANSMDPPPQTAASASKDDPSVNKGFNIPGGGVLDQWLGIGVPLRVSNPDPV